MCLLRSPSRGETGETDQPYRGGSGWWLGDPMGEAKGVGAGGSRIHSFLHRREERRQPLRQVGTVDDTQDRPGGVVVSK